MSLFPSDADVAAREDALQRRAMAEKERADAFKACHNPSELAALALEEIKALYRGGERTWVTIEWDWGALRDWVEQHFPNYRPGLSLTPVARGVATQIRKIIWEQLDPSQARDVQVSHGEFSSPVATIKVWLP